MMAPKKRDLNVIRVFVEGGLVQAVAGVPEGATIEIVDYDTDGIGAEQLDQVELDNGEIEGPAYVYRMK